MRLVRAFARCKAAGLPFIVKLGLRRDTLPLLEQTALFAARMGAASLSFGHNLPTSGAADDELSLGPEDRIAAEQEIAVLASILKMRVTLEVGYNNLDPEPPCSALAGVSCNVDYRGRLSLCCNLSGYRGAAGDLDIVADLNEEGFAASLRASARCCFGATGAQARGAGRVGARGRQARHLPRLAVPLLPAQLRQDTLARRGAAAAPRSLPVLQAV